MTGASDLGEPDCFEARKHCTVSEHREKLGRPFDHAARLDHADLTLAGNDPEASPDLNSRTTDYQTVPVSGANRDRAAIVIARRIVIAHRVADEPVGTTLPGAAALGRGLTLRPRTSEASIPQVGL